MSAQSDSNPGTELAESPPWYQIWFDAITKPSPKTYERIAADPNLSTRRAYTWIFVVALINFLITLSKIELNTKNLLLVMATSLFWAFSIIIRVTIIQAIAGMLGGSGNYKKLLYVVTSYVAPLTLLTTLIAIWLVSTKTHSFLLVITIGIYFLIMQILANKGVNQFGWGRAIFSSFVDPAQLLLVLLLMITVLAMLVPAFGDVFFKLILDG